VIVTRFAGRCLVAARWGLVASVATLLLPAAEARAQAPAPDASAAVTESAAATPARSEPDPASPQAQAQPPAAAAQAPAPLPAPKPPAPAKAEDPTAEFVGILEASSRATRSQDGRGRCRDLMHRVMDMDAVTSAVAVEFWSRMNGPQRTAFRAALDARMVDECASRSSQYRGGRLKIVGVRNTSGGDRLVTVREGDDGRMVTWRVRPARTRAVDIISDGHSLVGVARNEVGGALSRSNGDVDAMIASLRR
jgi:ABC-type transporter MlaC component